MIVVMVRIPVGSAEEGERIAGRFRNRLGAVDTYEGFLGFELLKGENEYISVTRWTNKEALDAWTASQSHAQAHGQGQGMVQPQAAQTGGHQAGEGGSQSGQSGQPASSVLMYEVVIPESGK
jgi:heme-degrading monooxygenase HmoA